MAAALHEAVEGRTACGASSLPAASRSSAASVPAAALASSELFGALDAATRARLARQLERVAVPGGAVVMRQGEPGDAMWIVVNGRLGVFGPPPASALIGEVGRGQVVGELALLSGRPRLATVRALRDTEMLRLSAKAFQRLVKSHPELLLDLAGTLVDRAARPTVQRRAKTATIAVVPAGGTDARALRQFCHDLATALTKIGSTHLVRAGDAQREVAPAAAASTPGDAEDGAVIAWLQRVEEEHDYVVYQADGRGSPWSARCVRQADRVLLVAAAGADAAVRPVEGLVINGDRRGHQPALVLVHPPGGAPSDAAPWLNGRAVASHHHVVAGTAPMSLARRLAGEAVGVVFGGGGAKGLAHLGVVRALEEAGVPIDLVGGASIGSVAAAMVAMGWDHETRVEMALKAFGRTRFLFGLTFPAVAMSSGKTLTRIIRQYFGDTTMEDLPIPCFTISTNLSSGKAVVHERGPLWWAIRASIAIPGVLPPVWHDEGLLVDGAVVDDLPVGPMRARLDGHVVAIELHPSTQGDADGGEASGSWAVSGGFGPAVSGWRVLGRKLNPFSDAPKLPGPFETLNRAKEVGVRLAQEGRHGPEDIDLRLNPPTDGHGSFDFKGAMALIEQGYRYASEQLSEGVPW